MSDSKESELLSKKDLYNRYWKCRDFELKTLWQRAIFLGPLLVMVFTGYGAFFLKTFVDDKTGLLRLFIYPDIALSHGVAMIIAVMGIIFSILWIYMMKGSKAWYEVYERAIIAMDTQHGWLLPEELLDSGGGFKYHRLPGYKKPESFLKPNENAFDDEIFSSKGGYFSPSKINIVIGQVSLVFWSMVCTLHTFVCLAFWIYPNLALDGFHLCDEVFFFFVLFVLVVSGVIAFLLAYNGAFTKLKDRCRSSSLQDKDFQRFEDEDKIAIQVITPNETHLRKLLKDAYYCQPVQDSCLYTLVKKQKRCGCIYIFFQKPKDQWKGVDENTFLYAIQNEDEWIKSRYGLFELKLMSPNEHTELFFKESLSNVVEELFRFIKGNDK